MNTLIISPENIKDGEFSRIKYSDLFDNSIAAFDFYSRVSSNCFLKIIPAGEKINSLNGASHLYFMKRHQLDFIKQQNLLAKELLKKSSSAGSKVITAMKSTIDKYFEEIKLIGIQPPLIEEGKAICQNMYDVSIQDKSLKKFINDLEQFNPSDCSQVFLVSFFSILICKELDWVGPKTFNILALGSLFYDIGFLKLPSEVQEMDPAFMTPEQKVAYHSHPTLGSEALKVIPGINEGIIQIVLQHREHINGTGFPNGLSDQKIYPLAKVVSLAYGFSSLLKEYKMSPIEALTSFLRDQQKIAWYDPLLIKSLIKAVK